MSNDQFASAWKRSTTSKSATSNDGQSDVPTSSNGAADATKKIVQSFNTEDTEKANSTDGANNPVSSKQKKGDDTETSRWNLRQWWHNLSSKKQRRYKIAGLLLGGLILLILLLGLLAFYSYVQAKQVEGNLRTAANEGRAAYTAFKTQNLPQAKVNLQNVHQSMLDGQKELGDLAWVGYVPGLKRYYEDAQAGFTAGVEGANAGLLVVEAIEPHADVLGFAGEGTFTGGTTQDRIALMLETLSQITPQLDAIAAKVDLVNEAVSAINPQDYPEDLMGYPVRSYVEQLHGAVEGAQLALTDARPVIEQLPTMAGATGERKKYLIIFQNDNELRPTGGFMTAYAVVYVEDGQVTPQKSDDIYELDQRFGNKPPIPEELGRYLTTETRWNIRDMNIDPNFASSMETMYSYYSNIRGEPDDIDGIIAVDTVLLADIVEILGPIEVPGYGTFTHETDPRCDCPQIIYALSEIIDRPTPYIREDRKGILAPMMQAIIAKTYATSRDKWPKLAELLWNSIQGRHAQFYFLDENLQHAAQSINAAGIIPEMPAEGDFLTVIDANLGGAKSNLFVEMSGEHEIQAVSDGRLTKQVELTYRNTHAASNCDLEAGLLCLNANLNNWTRWYVPKGAELIAVQGLQEGYELDTSHDDYDVIEGFFQLAPMAQAKIKVKYSVPYSLENQYRLTMQKQGGTDDFQHQILTPWGQTEFTLDKDTTVVVE